MNSKQLLNNFFFFNGSLNDDLNINMNRYIKYFDYQKKPLTIIFCLN